MMDILQAINNRHSTRTFTGEPINDNDCAALNRIISETTSPFGGKSHIFLRRFADKGATKPGTYGFITSCRDYLLLTYNSYDNNSVLDAGYRMERAVLEATRLGLGSCWLGGTFSRGDFARSINIPDKEQLHAVVAIGHGREKRRLLDRLSGVIAGSNNRKAFDSLFITERNEFRASLEAMRLAPSARNLQPWRAFTDGNTIHFYRTVQSAYTLLDSGIGLCHFHMAERFHGFDGEFFICDTPIHHKLEYVISYSRK